MEVLLRDVIMTIFSAQAHSIILSPAQPGSIFFKFGSCLLLVTGLITLYAFALHTQLDQGVLKPD